MTPGTVEELEAMAAWHARIAQEYRLAATTRGGNGWALNLAARKADRASDHYQRQARFMRALRDMARSGPRAGPPAPGRRQRR